MICPTALLLETNDSDLSYDAQSLLKKDKSLFEPITHEDE